MQTKDFYTVVIKLLTMALINTFKYRFSGITTYGSVFTLALNTTNQDIPATNHLTYHDLDQLTT